MSEPGGAAMQEIEQLEQCIRQQYSSLSKKLQLIARMSIDHPERLAFDNLSELSAYIGVYPSAFVRYAKHFGFRGFSDLQKLYRARYRQEAMGYTQRLDRLSDADDLDVFREISMSAVHSVENLLRTLDRQTLDRAVTMMADADTIWLGGTGRVTAMKMYMQYLLTRLGIVSQTISDNPALAVDQLALMTPKDTLMVASFVPYHESTVTLVGLARERGIPVISLSDSPLSPVVGGGVDLLYAESEYAGFRSLAATLNLSLYLAIQAGRQGKRARAV